jgi:hypothetical protein
LIERQTGEHRGRRRRIRRKKDRKKNKKKKEKERMKRRGGGWRVQYNIMIEDDAADGTMKKSSNIAHPQRCWVRIATRVE